MGSKSSTPTQPATPTPKPESAEQYDKRRTAAQRAVADTQPQALLSGSDAPAQPTKRLLGE